MRAVGAFWLSLSTPQCTQGRCLLFPVGFLLSPWLRLGEEAVFSPVFSLIGSVRPAVPFPPTSLRCPLLSQEMLHSLKVSSWGARKVVLAVRLVTPLGRPMAGLLGLQDARN